MKRPSRPSPVPMTRRGLAATALATLGLAGLVACNEPEKGPPAKKKSAKSQVQQKKAAEAPAIAPVAPTVAEWSYSPVGKRDPFRSYLADLTLKQTEDDVRRPDPTEKYELDQYRLTGLITGTAQPKALVEDPEKIGHVLRVGSRLGKNGGRITRISNTGIVVTEEYRAPTGEKVKVPIDVNLPKPPIEMESEVEQP